VVHKALIDTYKELGISTHRVICIHNGVEFPEQASRVEDKQQAKYELTKLNGFNNEAENCYWLVSLARIHPRKGQDFIIRVWNELSSEIRAKVMLFLVGPKTSLAPMQHLQTLLGKSTSAERIIFPGLTKEPEVWIQAADMYISGSEYEGMPLGPIEAIGAGVPAILSDIPGHRMLESYVDFFSLDQPDQGAMAITKHINKLELDYKSALQSHWQATQKIREQYSVHHMAKDYYQKAYC